MKTHDQPGTTSLLKYTWVMFDLDDTLISRTSDIVQQANIAALQLLSANAHDMQLLTEHLASVYQHTTQGSGVLVSKQQQFSQLLHRLGRSEGMEQLLAAYLASYISCIHVFPDVHATFSTLTAHGVHIGIATNGPPDVVEAVLQHCDMRQFVHCIVTPADVGAVKPAQAFATCVVAQTGVDPRQILFVGDRAEDIMTAKYMGATAVLVERGASVALEVKPDYIVQTLSDILPLCLSTAS